MNRKHHAFQRLSAALIALLIGCETSAWARAETTASQPAQPHTLENVIAPWLNRGELRHSFVGVEVMELPTGAVLFHSNGNLRFAPASTTKLISCACAYSLLGANYTYKTQLAATGQVTGDTVSGDLFVVPSQDPSFSRSDLQQLLSGVSKNKIHQITGAVRLEGTPGGFEVFQPNWLIEDFGQDYSPVCSNFVIDRNMAQGMPRIKALRNVIEGPNEHFNALERSLLTSEVAAGWIKYDPLQREVRGYIGSGVTERSPLSVADPDEYNLALVNDTLQQMGVKIGHPFVAAVPAVGRVSGAEQPPLAEHLSKPLSVIIQHTLHESDNLYAQQLVRTLGLPANGKASGMTLEDAGVSRMSRWLSSFGVPRDEAVLFDGCGLSRKNGISPHALNMVHKYMAGPNVDGPFLALLKHTGTSTGKGQFVFKTGSMDTVRSISGIVQTAGGQNLAVTIMVNDHIQSVKNLRNAFNDLIGLLNQITSIGFITVKPAIGGDKPVPAETKAVVEMTHASASTGSHSSPHRRRKHD